jgi:glutaredoxin-like protein NrdH
MTSLFVTILPMTFQAIQGMDKGKIVLYGLSTCMWCRMAKDLLKDLGVAFSFVDVDMLDASEKETAKKEIKKWNPECSYPTIILGDRECISGYDETEIREKIK